MRAVRIQINSRDIALAAVSEFVALIEKMRAVIVVSVGPMLVFQN